jgi:ribonuclease P protein component
MDASCWRGAALKEESDSLRRITEIRIGCVVRHEFQHVYRNGKRYDGVFITVFVLENDALNHRLGVTASKKALGKAVQRNRAKRLLRETFRSNEPSLSALTKNYDWVLNAKPAVLSQKLNAPREELEGIIEKVGRLEHRNPVR